MSKVTIEEMVNSASKDFLLTTLNNYFEISKEKRELIHGFRNSNLKIAQEQQLKNAVIEFVKYKGVIASVKNEEELTLEKFEELYNKKKWLCFGTLLLAVATNFDDDLCAEVYEKFFAPKKSEQPSTDVVGVNDSTPAEESNLLKVIDELKKKLNAANEKFQKDKAKLIDKHQRDLAKKTESIENLKKTKKDKEKEADELKADNEMLIKKNEDLINQLSKKDEDLQRLSIENARLQSELQEIKDSLDRGKPHILIYGYSKEFYDFDVRTDVIQPESYKELLSIGAKYKVSEIYCRPSSISRMSNIELRATYPGIIIADKDLAELESMGYLKIERKGRS